MVMMMAKTRGEEVSKPNIALTDPTGEKRLLFIFKVTTINAHYSL